MILRWIALLGVLAACLTKASVLLEALPHWDLDPFTIWAPSLALGPAGSLALDAVIIICAALGLFAESRQRRIHLWMIALLAIGAIGVILHALIVDPGIETLRIGGAWVAALSAGVALAHLGRDERLARVAGAIVVGFVAMLCAKGVIQVMIEHPATVQDYEANKGAFLAARGWTEDSMMARTFERRLYQPEASGWFGLSNVYASVVAGATVALIGLCVPGWLATRREHGRVADGFAGLLTLGVLLGGLALWLSHSRGGIGAVIIGVVLLIVGYAGSRLARIGQLGGVVGLLVIIAVLGLVVARGIVGERVGELSMLFRSFYLQGAMRAFLEHPLLGVGPDGFKDAYLLYKPPISPEEVASPHNVLAAYASTLGLFGFAWIALIVGLAWKAGAALFDRAAPDDIPERIAGTSRAEAWMLIGTASCSALVSVSIEAAGATPEIMTARLAGLAAWVGVGLGWLVVTRACAWRWCLGAMALALIAHALIEVSATWTGSAPLILAMIGLGAAGARPSGQPRAMVDRAAGVIVLLLGLLTAGAAGHAMRWESGLRRAADHAQVVADFRQRLLMIGPDGRAPSGDTIGMISRDLSRSLGEPVAPAALREALNELTRRQIDLATGGLATALAADRRHAEVLRTQSRLQLMAAQVAESPQDRDDQIAIATMLAERLVERRPHSAAAWHWLGSVDQARWELTGDDSALHAAMDAWARAFELDPQGMSAVLKLYEAATTLEMEDDARTWAAEALRIDEQMRLDPLRRLPDGQRMELQHLLDED